MKIRPLKDRIVVKRTLPVERVGGIIIPDTAREKPIEGEVISVGNAILPSSKVSVEAALKAGDRVLFGRYAGTEVNLEGDEYLILDQDDVLAVFSDAGDVAGFSVHLDAEEYEGDLAAGDLASDELPGDDDTPVD